MKAARFLGIAAMVAMLCLANASAWQPSGWVYHSGDYAYSSANGEWYFFSAEDMWVVDLDTGSWGHLSELDGWYYYTWRYCYSSESSHWLWFDDSDEQWACRMSDDQWSLLGIPYGMLPVEGGSYTMGDTWELGQVDESVTHIVSLDPFCMSKHEVTNEEMARMLNYAQALGMLDVRVSSVRNLYGIQMELIDLDGEDCQIDWNGITFRAKAGKGNFPCVEVSWYGAAAYCNSLSRLEGLEPSYNTWNWSLNPDANGYRLPTEAEWEYAAKGGTEADYTIYSGSDDVDAVAWHFLNSNPAGSSQFVEFEGEFHGTMPVGLKAENELGLDDMSGNLEEWCNDWYNELYYDNLPVSNPMGPARGESRVTRGGSWYDAAEDLRVSNRDHCLPSHTGNTIGFRCVRAYR